MVAVFAWGFAAEPVEADNLAGSSLVQATASKKAANPRAVPANYRQIVALKLSMVFNKGGVISAEISEPGETWMGLIRGGMQPAVCATVVHRDAGGSNWLFTFNNGKLDEALREPGAIYCMDKPMSPLRELISRR